MVALSGADTVKKQTPFMDIDIYCALLEVAVVGLAETKEKRRRLAGMAESGAVIKLDHIDLDAADLKLLLNKADMLISRAEQALTIVGPF